MTIPVPENRNDGEMLFRAIFEQAVVGIAQIVSKTGQFVKINQRLSDIIGHSREEMEERTFQEITHPNDLQADLDNMRRLLSGEIRQFSMEKRYFRKDGSIVWVNLTVSPLWGPGEEPSTHIAIVEDITERKETESSLRKLNAELGQRMEERTAELAAINERLQRENAERREAEEEREKLEAQLHQAQKMEAIGQLAGGIAHDFNNILTAIIGYSEIIIMRMEKDSPLRHYVEQIFVSAERAADLTNGLLAFSRKQVQHTKPIDLCEVVRGVKKMLRRLIPEDIDFQTIVAEKDLIVMADKEQIEQVLMNLVTNAKDAMPKGGFLTIEVHPAVMDKRFIHAHGFGEPGSYACISVTDTGHGMDEETRNRIFEPFFTTKEVGKGTGLGMAIIYGIINQHNGYINVYSEPDRGTAFRVYLPLIARDKKEVYDTHNAEPPSGGTETILLAEDDVSVRELHRMILEDAGYTVVEAADGQDAIDKFMERQAEVDILATDVMMPKIDGKSLYEEIRKICPDMKVLFMSGDTKDIVMERGILEGELSFMTKPVTSSELLKTVRNILDHD